MPDPPTGSGRTGRDVIRPCPAGTGGAAFFLASRPPSLLGYNQPSKGGRILRVAATVGRASRVDIELVLRFMRFKRPRKNFGAPGPKWQQPEFIGTCSLPPLRSRNEAGIRRACGDRRGTPASAQWAPPPLEDTSGLATCLPPAFFPPTGVRKGVESREPTSEIARFCCRSRQGPERRISP